ncbi:hypothetical protein EV182_001718 [Spiromyces aspiralis]|uniref:Uncharacterized protein n=1 Tax=Spiromyces aspiralis TaxID=68401 RepID=A0ACC1HWW7_9FUNG|nr:hypothetical protein EV182_001718 [Spiromyces aspiralis]
MTLLAATLINSIPTRQKIVDFIKTDKWHLPNAIPSEELPSVPPFWHFGARYRRMKQHFCLAEFSGALGDIGTFVPILISMSQKGQTSLGASLFFAGLFNILTGFYYGIPMCVQPMKSIASIAMTNGFSHGEVAGAGIILSCIVFGLGLTRLIWLVSRFIPLPVVRGLQLGTACQLTKTAVSNIKSGHATAFWGDNIKWSDNSWWLLASFIFVVIFYERRRVPTAMIIFIIGLILALIMTRVAHDYGLVHAGARFIHVTVPTSYEFREGFLQAGLGQLPLTLLNSVIALAALVYDLYPGYHLNISNIALSIGSMNIVGCFLGSMPFCHGSGGLAGQYFFGARTELSLYALGFFKVLLAVIFGDSLLGIVKHFPQSILAVMLFIAAVELGVNARHFTLHHGLPYRVREDFVILVATSASLVGFSHDGLGFITGMIIACIFWLRRHYWLRDDECDHNSGGEGANHPSHQSYSTFVNKDIRAGPNNEGASSAHAGNLRITTHNNDNGEAARDFNSLANTHSEEERRKRIAREALNNCC